METLESDWLEALASQIDERYPEGQLIVASGHSPSGTYHIGTLREIMTASAIAWALRQRGREARHIDFVDDFDALRKVPEFVPAEWSQYLGQPLAVVPDPFSCHKSYGAHFLGQLYEGLAALSVVPDETISGYEKYQAGAFAEQITSVLNSLGQVRRILKEVGGRDLPDTWSPVQILDERSNLRTLQFVSWDEQAKLVTWQDRNGATGQVPINDGRVKLDWRLDWPARWAKWGVTVEPFGRDHATKGGSYDTGEELVQTVFGGRAPYPVPYEFIVTQGQTKKMSKSTGNVLTPAEALSVMPPEILRYFVVGSRPSRTLTFDSGLGLYKLVDEYVRKQHGQNVGALAYARAGQRQATISPVPFNHLVSVYQTAHADLEQAREILERTGYGEEVRDHWPVLEREFSFVKNWLERYAPESVKFAVQSELPKLDLSQSQVIFLLKLADTIEQEDLNGQGMHDGIYAASQVSDMKPSQAFVTLYQVILGQDSGPKAGWFLTSLDRAWLVARLRAAAQS